MTAQERSRPATLTAPRWGDLAAERLQPAWLGRVWESSRHHVVLVDNEGEAVRLVTEEIGDGAFHVVVTEVEVPLWATLSRDTYAWRVGGDLWVGDDFTLKLPEGTPWASTLYWDDPYVVDDIRLGLHIAQLADWFLARAPESTMGGVLPDLLVSESRPIQMADRSDLTLTARLFRWRAARVLGKLMPALASGDLAAAESASNSLAGLGPGDPPVGDWFILGVIAGLQLWPAFLTEGSGLRSTSLVQRLARSVIERSSVLGRSTLEAAVNDHWDARWHALQEVLVADGPFPDDLRDHIVNVAAEWMEHDETAGSAALAGVITPFLWHQRFML